MFCRLLHNVEAFSHKQDSLVSLRGASSSVSRY